MFNFLVDEQLPPALARWIAAKGYAAQHVIDVDLGQAFDIDTVSFAQMHDLTLVSKDSDFLWLHAKDPGSFRLVHLAFGINLMPNCWRRWSSRGQRSFRRLW